MQKTIRIIAVLAVLISSSRGWAAGLESSGVYGDTVEILIKLSGEALSKSSTGVSGSKELQKVNERFHLIESPPLVPAAGKGLSKTAAGGIETVSGIHLVRLHTSTGITEILAEYSRVPGVEYAQPNNVYSVSQAMPDPRRGEQWYLGGIGIESAWDSTQGSPGIIIGIIDTGIDYNHEDLQGAVWINPGEDLNGNGRVDSSDYNGRDDDGNGFIDDVQGWDFTDAPGLADNGDYYARDNDPFDEMGHGTSVAGLVGAVKDNGKGIAGAAPGCRIMNLRAGTSKGYLQEDDVASAVLYAVLMGARVINMSFGDLTYSNVLRDVIRFARANGVTVVASKGNGQTDEPHFPSDFTETISVGAVDNTDKLATFSNFGPLMDLVAPGVNLLTTKKGDQYGSFSGTSAAAPLVSAAAGILLSMRPDLNPDEIKSILRESAADLGGQGVDSRFGAGKLNAGAAARSAQPTMANIEYAGFAWGDDSRIVLTGSAGGGGFKSFSTYYSTYPDTLSWTGVDSGVTRQVLHDTLAIWERTALPAARIYVRLVAHSISGRRSESRAFFLNDNSAPRVLGFSYRELLRGTEHLLHIECATDRLTTASVYYKADSESAFSRRIRSELISKTHSFQIPVSASTGNIEFGLEVRNENGAPAFGNPVDRTFRFAPSARGTYAWTVKVEKTGIPPLYLLPGFFQTGSEDYIAGTIFDSRWSLGAVGFFRNPGEVYRTPVAAIARGAGDFDRDARADLLAGIGSTSFVYEMGADPADLASLAPVWTSPEEHWAAGAHNIIGDSLPELFFRSDKDYLIYRNTKDNIYEKAATLSNFTSGSNTPGVPHFESGDFDNDGMPEILMGDADGDIYLYENRDGEFFPSWSFRLRQVDAVDFIATGDLDGNGVPEIIAGCHSSSAFGDAADSESHYWTFSIFRNTGDNEFAAVKEWNFSPFQTLEFFSSGCVAGDIDGDGRDELVLSLYPNIYIAGYNPERRDFEILWAGGPDVRMNDRLVTGENIAPARSSRFIIDARHGLLYTSGEGVYRLIRADGVPNQNKPVNLMADITGREQVRLSWDNPSGIAVFIERKSITDSLFRRIGDSAAGHFTDTTVSNGIQYTYRILTGEGWESQAVIADVHNLPFLEKVEIPVPGHLLLTFSEDMGESVLTESAYLFQPEGPELTSTEYYNGSRSILATFNAGTVKKGAYTVRVDPRVQDTRKAFLDPARNTAYFEVIQDEGSFYIVSAEPLDPEHIAVTFSDEADEISALMPENYELRPFGLIDNAEILRNDRTRVVLSLSRGAILARGNYTLSVRHIRSRAGMAITPQRGDEISFVYEPVELAVSVYPNPYIESEGEGHITFLNVTFGSEILILNASGQVLRRIRNNEGGNRVEWQLDDESGNRLASGIYIYYIKKDERTVKGKIAVIR